MTKKELNINIVEQENKVAVIVERREQGELKETLTYNYEANEPAIAALLMTLISTSINKQK